MEVSVPGVSGGDEIAPFIKARRGRKGRREILCGGMWRGRGREMEIEIEIANLD